MGAGRREAHLGDDRHCCAHLGERVDDRRRPLELRPRAGLADVRVSRALGRAQRLAARRDAGSGRDRARAGDFRSFPERGIQGTGRIFAAGVLEFLHADGHRSVRAAGEGAGCGATLPRTRISCGAGNLRDHLRLPALLEPYLSPHPRARRAGGARRRRRDHALRDPQAIRGFRSVAKMRAAARLRIVLPGFSLILSGCGLLDRFGDTKLTDGNAPVFPPEVPYFPSTDEAVIGMLKLAGTGPNDVVYDLGCGDGRIVIAAAKDFGARGVGVESDPEPQTTANSAPGIIAATRRMPAGCPVWSTSPATSSVGTDTARIADTASASG